ncbi:metalloregulator ArsR/SmtB family transcription factor [Sinorhizobium alkalisoli]|uniref:Transcriptional regulator n=1 Tax=Sinorhizobium alkalisoli TaxID=1752398 RepID=A0A1E3V6J6_9HYPH|nr:metalloregulator ArsR/SmtB family transcription factor [Sinorhizobium alkalisoli]MCA1489975.1 winged helix-turn-helix transcriptional regulator [Ensifer sp. NBAIM29]MCG5477654.1 winged helix-turn-helix domain-containing protein [Sinorhizobium alkalisoli]ODR89254.1 transcriptional regulator [Sinorhizobium alkalisoli]QFI65714.1 Transcriptional regulator, ArsR family [Sinorhizobium alkalisoli]
MISALDDTLLALADPTRRRILEVLLAGEASAADIAIAVGVRRDELLRHMTVLEEAELISRRSQGEGELIAANPAPLEIAAEWINTNRELWAMRSQMQET